MKYFECFIRFRPASLKSYFSTLFNLYTNDHVNLVGNNINDGSIKLPYWQTKIRSCELIIHSTDLMPLNACDIYKCGTMMVVVNENIRIQRNANTHMNLVL